MCQKFSKTIFWEGGSIFSMPIILYTYCIWNGAWMLSNVGHWGTVGFLDVFSLSVVKLHCSSWEVKKCSEEKLRHDENIFIFCFMLFFLFFMSYESCPFISQFSWYLVAGMWQIIYLSSVLPLPVSHISFTFLVINLFTIWVNDGIISLFLQP